MAHELVPRVWLHVVPQLPQSVSVLSGVSQPFASIPSQSSHPSLQAVMVHVPVAHDSLAFTRLQLVPQEPQFESVSSRVSQPFAGSPSQLPQPALHVPSVHVPVAQDSLAFGRLHGTPQPPQLESVLKDVSQPFAGRPSQFAHPASQAVTAHDPVAHDSVAFERLQLVPQAPQSVRETSCVSHPSLTSPLQLPQPSSQVRTQLPEVQDGVA